MSTWISNDCCASGKVDQCRVHHQSLTFIFRLTSKHSQIHHAVRRLSLVTQKAAEVQAGQILFSSSCGYTILDFIGEGCFGKVAKCRNLATKQTVAVKILKEDSDMIEVTRREVDL